MTTWRHLKTAVDTACTIVLVAATVVAVRAYMQGRLTGPEPAQPQSAAIDGLRLDPAAVRHVEGRAPLALVEFTDYECPFCAAFARETFPEVRRALIDTGALRYVVVNFPLTQIHASAMRAAEAAECASHQGHYWEMHDRLFASSPDLSYERVMEQAGQAGLDRDAFVICLEGQTTNRVAADRIEGQRLGVSGTPSFFLGRVAADGTIELRRRISGPLTVEWLRREIEALAAGHLSAMNRGDER
jgi:protein-disulfide isomerase